MTMDGKWTLDFNFSVFPPIIIATLLHCYKCYIATSLNSLTSSSRLSALEEGSAVDYSYNNYEHAAAAASTRNTDVVSYGTWKQSAERGKTTWTENSKYCHFYLTFWEAFKCAQKYAWIRKNFFWNVWRPLTEPSPSNSCSFVLIWLFIWLKDLKPQLEMTKDILNISVMNL